MQSHLLNHICNESSYHYGCHDSSKPGAITCFSFDRLVTLPQFVLITAGFNLS